MSRLNVPAALAALGLALATVILVDVASACEDDFDCKGARVCQAGKCVTPAPPPSAAPAPSAAPVPPAAAQPAPPVAPPPPPAVPPTAPPAAAGPPAGPFLAPAQPAGRTARLPEPRRVHRRSVGLIVTGFVTLGLGALVAPVGLGIVAGGADAGSCQRRSNGFTITEPCTDEGVVVPGAILAGTGLGLIGLGLPLAIIGLQKEPTDEIEDARALSPAVRVGPTSAGAAWTF